MFLLRFFLQAVVRLYGCLRVLLGVVVVLLLLLLLLRLRRLLQPLNFLVRLLSLDH